MAFVELPWPTVAFTTKSSGFWEIVGLSGAVVVTLARVLLADDKSYALPLVVPVTFTTAWTFSPATNVKLEG